jgi:hypothetical protein
MHSTPALVHWLLRSSQLRHQGRGTRLTGTWATACRTLGGSLYSVCMRVSSGTGRSASIRHLFEGPGQGYLNQDIQVQLGAGCGRHGEYGVGRDPARYEEQSSQVARQSMRKAMSRTRRA